MDKEKRHDPHYLISKIERAQKEGVPERDIYQKLGFASIGDMRKFKSGFYAATRVVYGRWAKYLEKEGKTRNEIALIIGKNESTVRMLLDDEIQTKLAEEA